MSPAHAAAMHAAEMNGDLAPQALELAHALPARFYTARDTSAQERDLVFGRSWHLIAHASRLRDAGDHVVSDCAGLPVIAVRGVDGDIRAFHNVCRHRAGPLALCDGRAAQALRCRYHGWTYGLDGTLKSAPEMTGARDFDLASIRLPKLQAHVWQGLVFVAQEPRVAFDTVVDGIEARIGGAPSLADYRHHQHVAYDIACNWKVYVDNYLEGYHLPHVHPALNRMLDYRSYRTELAPWHSLQWSPLRMSDESDGDSLYGSGDALYYWLWPNTMLNVLPGRLQTNRVVPLDVDRCRVEFDFYYPPDDSGAARAHREADLAFSDDVQHEDLAICEDVQRGLASGSYVAGRLNPLRESGVHHFHERLRSAYRGGDA